MNNNVITEKAPNAVTQSPLESFAGKVVACNASMAIYQSVVASQFGSTRGPQAFTDDSGLTSAHLLGLFHKTLQFLELDIKPIWVFDGKMPPLKAKQLAEKRKLKAEQSGGMGLVYHSPGQGTSTGSETEAPTEPKSPPLSLIYKQCNQKKRSITHVRELEVDFSTAHSQAMNKLIPPVPVCPDYCCTGESDDETLKDRELHSFLEGLRPAGDAEEAKQALRVTREMTEDAMLLLTLLGVPVIVAPGEAEAQCAALVSCGRAFAVVSEEVDALVFGAKTVLRGVNLNKQPVTEISLPRVLSELALTYHQFVDLCILLGYDYCPTVNCAGPNTALKLIKEHGTLENVLTCVAENRKKWTIPADFPYQDVRELFTIPEALLDFKCRWVPPNEAQLSTFFTMVKGFQESKIDYGLRKAKKLEVKPVQRKLDSYFGEAKRKASDTLKGVPMISENFI